MKNVMKKEFYLLEVINVVSYFNMIKNDETKKGKFAELSPKTYFALKRNISTLSPIVKEYEDMRNEFAEKLKQDFFINEDKSEECKVPKTDPNTNKPVLDENGEQIMEDGRKVKDEYQEEFMIAQSELERKLQEVLVEKNEYQIHVVDLFEELDRLPEDTMIDNDDIDILTFMDRGDE